MPLQAYTASCVMRDVAESGARATLALCLLIGLACTGWGCEEKSAIPSTDARIQDGSETADTALDASSDAQFVPTDASPDTNHGCPSCASDQGCVSAEVVRVERTDLQPWEWGDAPGPTVDGVGTLVVSLLETPADEVERLLSRQTVSDADMRPRDARYRVELGCVSAATEIQLSAFLDDDMNASDSEWTSSSFGDSCMNSPRVLSCTVRPGEMIFARLALSSQCYHVFDFPESSRCRP